MMEELAHVLAYQNGWAQVEVQIKSACNHCSNQDNCGTSTIAKAFSVKTQQFSIASKQPCQPGDMLKIALPESVVIKSAALVYLLPLFGLLGFGLLGQFLAQLAQFNPDVAAMLFGFAGGFISWLGAKRIAKRVEAHAQPVIVQYLGQRLSTPTA
ncbi:SoxR reducing system RseC family protein [Shewanella sp. WXL01]|uniref:Fis family transcriptional regulator n=1 Tax=Shewanella maritima TaxID=2520507 RepID=A0A411PN63_9GAMM|nr:SoxR reducing system RseC family protein [Shewanella maritima]NKF50948.1 SoxR reducing system RseC family protein [Shewanella sp. WXL01]QBF84936.1 Fis family transcriptional regulator [Shewanella maritima]